MSKGRNPDPRRKKISSIRSTNFKVANGGKEIGYVAGEVYGVNGHFMGAHKPCLHDLTNGEVQCVYCAVNKPIEWRGYVPVWDQDYTLRHALITEDYLEAVNMIPWRARIVATRAAAQYSPLVIRAADLPALRGLPDKAPWDVPIDIEPICRRLWQEPALDAWYAATHAKQAGLSAGAPPLDPSDFSPMMRSAAAHANRIAAHAAANDEFAKQAREGKVPAAPSTNGHHKPPKKG